MNKPKLEVKTQRELYCEVIEKNFQYDNKEYFSKESLSKYLDWNIPKTWLDPRLDKYLKKDHLTHKDVETMFLELRERLKEVLNEKDR